MSHDEYTLRSLDAQIAALDTLIRENPPFPGDEGEEPYRTYVTQHSDLVDRRRKISNVHLLGELAEQSFPNRELLSTCPSDAEYTRMVGSTLRDHLLKVGWVDPDTHAAVVADSRERYSQAEKLVEFVGRVANLLNLPATANAEQIVQAIAKRNDEDQERFDRNQRVVAAVDAHFDNPEDVVTRPESAEWLRLADVPGNVDIVVPTPEAARGADEYRRSYDTWVGAYEGGVTRVVTSSLIGPFVESAGGAK